MSAPASLRTKPIDRRRLSRQDRATYQPQNRLGAIARAKAFKSDLSSDLQRKPFATEQKPGTGGFTQGLKMQQQRLKDAGDEKQRAEAFRPENIVSADIYKVLAKPSV